VAVANGKTTAQACKEAEIVEQTYFRWRKEYGGPQVDQARRLRELEQENAKLWSLENSIGWNRIHIQTFPNFPLVQRQSVTNRILGKAFVMRSVRSAGVMDSCIFDGVV
jgi:putative transposase